MAGDLKFSSEYLFVQGLAAEIVEILPVDIAWAEESPVVGELIKAQSGVSGDCGIWCTLDCEDITWQW